jgi:hypothetical protein
VLIFIILSIIGLWFFSGVNQTWRRIVNQVIPDKYLPDIKDTIPTSDYTQLQPSSFSIDEENGDEVKEVEVLETNEELSSSSSSDSEFDPRKGS